MFWTKKNSRVYYCAWLLLIMLLERAKTQDIPDRCILNFTVQPVTSVDCNVYETDLEVLTCTVELLSTADVADPQDILIKWFFFNDTEYEVAVGVNPPQGTGGNGGHVTVTSTLHISGTSQPNASYVSEGFYYCQVQITDRSVQSKPSQKFEVFNRDQHLQASSSCSERTFTAPLQSCAVYRIREDTPTTTGPISVHYTSTDSAMPCSTERDTTTPPVWTEGQSTPPLITRTEGSERPLERIWIYVLASLAGAFAIIILILVVSFVLICRFRIATNVEGKSVYIYNYSLIVRSTFSDRREN